MRSSPARVTMSHHVQTYLAELKGRVMNKTLAAKTQRVTGFLGNALPL
jgi:hypothetical protein